MRIPSSPLSPFFLCWLCSTITVRKRGIVRSLWVEVLPKKKEKENKTKKTCLGLTPTYPPAIFWGFNIFYLPLIENESGGLGVTDEYGELGDFCELGEMGEFYFHVSKI